ncbi:MAG: helicase HerA domain-containing protein [Halanaeroarchaeum sp.]
MSTEDAEELVISDDGVSLPAIEVLTGRGVIFGKSGSGKSNSASVVIEELLEHGFPLLIVDIEGEYYTLKERYEVVHIGATDRADMPLRETDAEEVVTLCLDRNRPVIIDLSEVMDMDPAEYFVDQVLTILFSREKEARKPFLVVVEEIHEFLPQQGGLDELGETLIRIAKRGRKRGLGMTGMSQRPAAVDKDFITQCDWLVWHRLTWKNDTQVVRSILGSEKASEVQELETGEAIMMTDWDETIRTVRFRRKRTYDAADTPTLSPENRPDLTTEDATSRPSSAAGTDQATLPPDGSGGHGGSSVGDTGDGDEQAAGPPSDESSGETSRSTDTSAADGREQTDESAESAEAGRRAESSDRSDREGEGSASGATGDALEIKTFDPPTNEAAANQSSETRTATRETAPPSQKSVTDVPKKHADPPFEDGDSRTALWELGHMVSYVFATLLAILTRTVRYGVDVAHGSADEPFDPLAPATNAGGDAPLSRDQMVLLLAGLLLLVVLVLGFALP